MQPHKASILIEEEMQTNCKSNYTSNKGYYKKDKKFATSSMTKNKAHVVEISRPPQPLSTYIPLRMKLRDAFKRHESQSVLKPIGPILNPPEEKKTKLWGPRAYCQYHQG